DALMDLGRALGRDEQPEPVLPALGRDLHEPVADCEGKWRLGLWWAEIVCLVHNEQNGPAFRPALPQVVQHAQRYRQLLLMTVVAPQVKDGCGGSSVDHVGGRRRMVGPDRPPVEQAEVL